jgi:uncharacterized protein YndB with AHSA1/START domain
MSATKTESKEIRITRLYDAPVRAVWDAWTDPAQVAQWWGPRGFTITTHEKDLRPGGHWSYTMHGPDGTDYINKTLYYEVEECAKLVYDHGGNDDRAPLFHVTVLFSETRGKTKLEITFSLATIEAAREIREVIRQKGGNSTWDRLAEFLEERSTGKTTFVINRVFDAPIERVFECWTDPRHISRWLPPAGAEIQFLHADIRPGGRSFYVMSGAGGVKLYGQTEYLEIRKPDRIVYTQQFRDEKNEQVTRHPMNPTWPATLLATVQLTAETADQTRVTLTWEPHGDVTPEERDTFVNSRANMTQGWTGSFDKLEELLARQ